MLSSSEIRSIEFEKCMRGYRPEQVAETLDTIAAQLEQVQKEKDDMEKKLYILASKVEEYRNDEDMLKTAMINAQRMGESVIKEARQKADHIMREADLNASLINEKAKEKLQSEEACFVELQEKVAKFKSEVLAIYKSHIESLSDLPVDENFFPAEDRYAEVKDTDFSNVIASQAEALAEPIIEQFEQENEQEDDIAEEENAVAFEAFNDVELSAEPIKDSLGLNGVDYDRIGIEEDEDTKIFDPSLLSVNNEQNDDDIIEIPPLKKSVFDIFGETN